MLNRHFIVFMISMGFIIGQCFDTEISEADFPYNNLVNIVNQDDDWDQSEFPYEDGSSHSNGANGPDYTYKLTLTQPANIYITTCDSQTNTDVQIAVYEEDCDATSWILFQDDSNSPIYYPNQDSETYQFECLSALEQNPNWANMLPLLELDAGIYYIVIDDRSCETCLENVKIWFGYSLIVDSTSISDNYSDISYYFSEGVFGGDYTDVYNGNGIAVEPEDFSLGFNPNGGNANDANIISITTLADGVLSPGIQDVKININISGTPSGSEIITIGPASVSSIFNNNGVPLLDVDGVSIFLPDALSPSIISSNPFNGQENVQRATNINLTFSEAVRYVDNSAITDLNADNCFLLENIENGDPLSFTISTTNNLSFEIIPDELLPNFSDVRLSLLSSIEDFNDNLISLDNFIFTTEDDAPPIIEEGNILASNNIVEINFNKGVYSSPDGNGGLSLNDFNYSFQSNGGNCESISVNNLTSEEGLSLIGGESTVYVQIEPGDIASGEETIIFFPTNGSSIFDENGNAMSVENGTGNLFLRDLLPPSIDSYLLATDNSYIDLFFNDGIYGDSDATGVIQPDDIDIELISNGSDVDSCFITSMTRTDSNQLSGGESSIRVLLEYNGTPDGNETIKLAPIVGAEIFDENGNQFFDISFTESIVLYDILPPSIDSISFPIDSFIVLMESAPITFNFNEKVDSLVYSISSVVMDSVNYSSILTDSSLKIILQPPFASYDSILINFSYMEDISNLNTVNLSYTFRTPILGDFDFDEKLTYNDMWDLVENWEAKNFNYELGPFIGSVPHLISFPDSKFDIEDGMAFVGMWSWYQKTFGEIDKDTLLVGNALNFFERKHNIYIIISDSTNRGMIQVVYEPGTSPISFKSTGFEEKNLMLSNHSQEKGFSILEFARSGSLTKDTIIIEKDQFNEATLFYDFHGDKNTDRQKGYVKFNKSSIPDKFLLYPAYPNPFNPVTTFRIDIPFLGNQEQNNSLIIFDVQGRKIKTLLQNNLFPGTHEVKWNAQNYSTGIYFAQLNYGNYTKTQKVIYLK